MLFPSFKEVNVHKNIERVAKENDGKSMGITLFEREVKYPQFSDRIIGSTLSFFQTTEDTGRWKHK